MVVAMNYVKHSTKILKTFVNLRLRKALQRHDVVLRYEISPL